MLGQNYFPLAHQGITLKLSGKIDPWRIYVSKVNYSIAPILLTTDFDDKKFTYEGYGEFLLFEVNGKPDYSIITSLN
jgi:hypothetical protein